MDWMRYFTWKREIDSISDCIAGQWGLSSSDTSVSKLCNFKINALFKENF